MKKVIAAFATDDGSGFIDRHFGDAQFYELYSLSTNDVKYLKQIANTTEDDEGEEEHGDKKKAGGITAILKKEGVQVVVSPIFGPNLKRIKKKFVCVISQDSTIEDSLKTLLNHFQDLVDLWEDGEDRTFKKL